MPTFFAYGTTFRVDGNDAECLDEAVQRAHTLRWAGTVDRPAQVQYALTRTQRSGAGGATYELRCDDALIRASSDRQDIIEAFEDHAKLETAYRANGCVFVHAGAVAWHGHGIVLPGHSRAGKTTLVRALLDLGAEYYSDEFAVVDKDGRLRPYPLPLSVRESGVAGRVRMSAAGGDWRVAVEPVPINLIAVTEYRHGARWRPRRLSQAHGLLALMANTVAATRPPDQTMPILRDAVARARIVESKRGAAGRVAQQLLAELFQT